jgi:predicted metal-binding membrane protein
MARVLRQPRASAGRMSTAASEIRPLAAPTASAVLPVSFLVAIAGGCWVVTVQRMQGMDMDMGPGTDLGGLGWFAVVWLTMMAAMMLPSLSPMAVADARVVGRGQARSIARTIVFAAGYLLPWVAFGVLAYALVEGVQLLHLSFLAWDRAGQDLAGGVILGAALYELTTAKARCLRRCRDSHLLRPRPGPAGALVRGMEQGAFCVGCSGALMAALFALGVMGIAWMLLIAALVAIEKLLPWTVITIGATAAVLALLGVAILFVPDQVPWLTIPMSM